MSSGEARKDICEDMQLVLNLVERCLQLYMSQKEVMNTLLGQENTESEFIEHVWKKLEDENPEFFKAYHLRLIVKDQINQFNKLLDSQVELRHQVCPAGVASMPMSNGSHIPPLHHNSTCFSLENIGSAPRTESMHRPIGSSSLCTFPNGGSLLHPCVPDAVDMFGHARRTDVSPDMLLVESSNIGMVEGMHGGVIKSQAGYAATLPYIFSNEENVLEVQPSIGNASVSSFNTVGSRSPPLEMHLWTERYAATSPSVFSIEENVLEVQPSIGNASVSSFNNVGSGSPPVEMHLWTESIQPIGSSSLCTFPNGGSSLHRCMPNAVDMFAHARRTGVSQDMLLVESSNIGMIQGMNGGMIKSQAGYAGISPFMFSNEENELEVRPSIGNASVSSFNNVGSGSRSLHETIRDAENSSFGRLGQITQNFSLSDLTAEFPSSYDIMENYSRSPFLATDADIFLDPYGRGEQQGDRTLSEGEDFGSD